MRTYLLPVKYIEMLKARGYEHIWSHLDRGNERYLRVTPFERKFLVVDESKKRTAYIGTLDDVHTTELFNSLEALEQYIWTLYQEHPERHYVFPE